MKKSKVFISITVFIIILTSINYITNKTEHNIAYNDHTPRMTNSQREELKHILDQMICFARN